MKNIRRHLDQARRNSEWYLQKQREDKYVIHDEYRSKDKKTTP